MPLCSRSWKSMTCKKLLSSHSRFFAIKIKTRIGVSKVETNQDPDRDFLTCRDFGFWTVETFSSIKTWVFELSRLRISIKTMSKVEILGHKPCWDIGFWIVEIESLDRDHVKTLVFELSRLSWQSRYGFLNFRDFLDSRDMGFWTVETKSHNRDKSGLPSLIKANPT